MGRDALVYAFGQVIRPALLKAGFELVRSQSLEVTDDVSIIEALREPVQITKGAYTNIKASPEISSDTRLERSRSGSVPSPASRRRVSLRNSMPPHGI